MFIVEDCARMVAPALAIKPVSDITGNGRGPGIPPTALFTKVAPSTDIAPDETKVPAVIVKVEPVRSTSTSLAVMALPLAFRMLPVGNN
jgi:hypothetical protein